MPIDKPHVAPSGIIPIIRDVELPRIQVTIWDVPGQTAELWALLQKVARLLRHEERMNPKREPLTYARLCGAHAEAIESFGTGERQ